MPTYRIACDACGFKKTTDGTEVGLREVPRSPIQGRIPTLKDGKTQKGTTMNQPKAFKCPGCGRQIRAVAVKEPPKP